MILKPKGLFVIQEKKNVSKTPTPVHTPRKLTFKDRCNRRGGCTLHLQQFSSGCVGDPEHRGPHPWFRWWEGGHRCRARGEDRIMFSSWTWVLDVYSIEKTWHAQLCMFKIVSFSVSEISSLLIGFAGVLFINFTVGSF